MSDDVQGVLHSEVPEVPLGVNPEALWPREGGERPAGGERDAAVSVLQAMVGPSCVGAALLGSSVQLRTEDDETQMNFRTPRRQRSRKHAASWRPLPTPVCRARKGGELRARAAAQGFRDAIRNTHAAVVPFQHLWRRAGRRPGGCPRPLAAS